MKTTLTTLFAALILIPLSADHALAKGKKDCPPGLAKKSPVCVPPGLAKKGVTAEDWQSLRGGEEVTARDEASDEDENDGEIQILADGDRVTIDGEEYIVIESDDGPILQRGDDLFDLPGAFDEYLRVGDSLIRVDPETKAAIELIQLVDLIAS